MLESLIQCLNSSVCASHENSAKPLLIGGKHGVVDEVSVEFSSKYLSKKGKENDITNLTSSIDKHGKSLLKVANIAALEQKRDHALAQSIPELILFVK